MGRDGEPQGSRKPLGLGSLEEERLEIMGSEESPVGMGHSTKLFWAQEPWECWGVLATLGRALWGYSPSKQQRAGEEELPPLTRHKVHPPASKGAGFCADRAFRGRLNVLLEHLFSLSHKKGWMAIGDQQEMGKDQH